MFIHKLPDCINYDLCRKFNYDFPYFIKDPDRILIYKSIVFSCSAILIIGVTAKYCPYRCLSNYQKLSLYIDHHSDSGVLRRQANEKNT